MTPYKEMQDKGWECETWKGTVHVGPRGMYNALFVLGKGYTLREALDQALARKLGKCFVCNLPAMIAGHCYECGAQED